MPGSPPNTTRRDGNPKKTHQVRGGAHRTLAFIIAAVLAGYLIAGWARTRFRDTRDAERHFETMNTYARIRVLPGPSLTDSPEKLAELAENTVKRVAELMAPVADPSDPDASDVVKLNNAPPGEWVAVNPLTWTVVMESLRWHRLTNGAFDPTIGPIKRLFRFEQTETAAWPSDAALNAARENVGAEKLLFEREGMRLAWKKDGMRLDLGAIAKGFSADLAAQTLIRHGVTRALVDIGGELRLIGQREPGPDGAWRTGIKSPRGDEIVEKLQLADTAVATSGDYERFFTYKGKRYEHIIDPRTGLPITKGPASVTVIHPSSCLAADALATTMCVMGPDEGRTFVEEQAQTLFAEGVRIIMLTQDRTSAPDHARSGQDGGPGAWRKITITVNEEGDTTYENEPIDIFTQADS